MCKEYIPPRQCSGVNVLQRELLPYGDGLLSVLEEKNK